MLPRCLAAVAEHVDEIVDRRHRLHRPHRRDRRVVRRHRRRLPLERLLCRRPQRLARRGDRRLDPLARRRRGAGRRRRPAAARARHPLLARGLLRPHDERAGRGRRRGLRPPDDAPLPQPARVPLRRPHPRAAHRPDAAVPAGALRGHRPARPALRLRRRARRRARQGRAQPLAARARRRGEGRRSVHALQPRHRASLGGPSGRGGRCCSRRRGRWPSTAGGQAPQYLPSLAVRVVQAYRLAGEPEQALGVAEQALVLYPDHTDVVREAALSARDRGRARPCRRALRALPRAGRRARALRGRDRRRHVPRARPARLDPLDAAPLRRGRRAARALARRASRVHAGALGPGRRSSAAGGRRVARESRWTGRRPS